MDALTAAGGEARFVGGCVRDTLTGHPVGDIDIATTLMPDQVIAALKAAGLKAVPTGVDHGTVTAVSAGKPFEITTLRRDVETDGRRAVVAFTADWAEDAGRRDFRLNALYAEPDRDGLGGALHDPTGGGIEDARAGRIVFVGEPETRTREDYLRILRFFRFYAGYGRGEPDPAGLEACARLRDGLARLSGERIARELLKLLDAPDPGPSVRAMASAGVLEALLPGAEADRLDALLALERAQGLERGPELRLSALTAPEREAVAALARRLRLSNALGARLLAAVGDWTEELTPRGARRAVYALGRRAAADRLAKSWSASPNADWVGVWREVLTWRPPPFPLTGEDIKARGVPEGPGIGRVRRAVEAWWVANDFPTDREAALAALDASIGASDS
jgi:poly(A) polymerase